MHTKEHLAALIPSGAGLLLNTLRWSDEIRDLSALDLPASAGKSPASRTSELKMAEQLIGDMTVAWKPESYTDHFADAIHALVQQRVAAGKTEKVEALEPVGRAARQQRDRPRRASEEPGQRKARRDDAACDLARPPPSGWRRRRRLHAPRRKAAWRAGTTSRCPATTRSATSARRPSRPGRRGAASGCRNDPEALGRRTLHYDFRLEPDGVLLGAGRAKVRASTRRSSEWRSSRGPSGLGTAASKDASPR